MTTGHTAPAEISWPATITADPDPVTHWTTPVNTSPTGSRFWPTQDWVTANCRSAGRGVGRLSRLRLRLPLRLRRRCRCTSHWGCGSGRRAVDAAVSAALVHWWVDLQAAAPRAHLACWQNRALRRPECSQRLRVSRQGSPQPDLSSPWPRPRKTTPDAPLRAHLDHQEAAPERKEQNWQFLPVGYPSPYSRLTCSRASAISSWRSSSSRSTSRI